jgi:hypothetical protein
MSVRDVRVEILLMNSSVDQYSLSPRDIEIKVKMGQINFL